MPLIELRYRPEPGAFGSMVIVQSGRCSGDQATINSILEGCVRRFDLSVLPQARGVVLKPLDGTVPSIVEIEPPTMNGKKFLCVKVGANVVPFAPTQSSGVYEGETVMMYEIRWQQVGDL